MIPLVRAAQMREIDRTAIQEMGVGSLDLMETAGRAVAEAVLAHFGAEEARRVLVVCGKGNNGGDGLVAARYFAAAGCRPRVVVIGSEAELSDDARAMLARWTATGGATEFLPDDGAVMRFFQNPPACDVAVDALLGTGATGQPRGPVLEAIRGLNRLGRPIAAIDIPSGIDADSGAVPGAAVDADLTVTLGLPKRGLWLYPARERAGVVEVADIGLPREASLSADVRDFLVQDEDAPAWLPAWPRNAHKGTRGRLLIVGGSEGLTGAPCLAAGAALRVGAGLVTVGAPSGLVDILAAKLTEAMTLALPQAPARCLAPEAMAAVESFDTVRLSAAVLGPGLSRREPAAAFARAMVAAFDRPMVVDADALHAFENQPDLLARRRAGTTTGAAGPLVLTPHPGEAAWLMGQPAHAIDVGRIDLAREWSARLGQVIVLKGAPTVIGSPEGEAFVNPTGGPLLATGGTGDVLAGLIGGLLAQGASPLNAALLGVWLHGFLADLFEE
ncbi:MAG TPA: NAD(P)H-hydrate dehydratase, partial [Candidatus Eisenbacteria bacterium]